MPGTARPREARQEGPSRRGRGGRTVHRHDATVSSWQSTATSVVLPNRRRRPHRTARWSTSASCRSTAPRCSQTRSPRSSITCPLATISIREHGVDPAAIEALRRIADAAPSPVRLEFDPANPGFGAGCNALARGGRAPWVLFLNPDARILSWPWTATARPPTNAVVGPLMDGSCQPERHSGVTYRITDEIKRSWFRRNGPRPNGRGFVSGAAMLIDRDSFERVGGFDERYFMFYEDIDLCLRANELGIETRIDPGWQVRHEGAHSTSATFRRVTHLVVRVGLPVPCRAGRKRPAVSRLRRSGFSAEGCQPRRTASEAGITCLRHAAALQPSQHNDSPIPSASAQVMTLHTGMLSGRRSPSDDCPAQGESEGGDDRDRTEAHLYTFAIWFTPSRPT